MSVVYFLVLLGVLVTIHELGHFAAAKLLHVKVLRFSLGMGRPLLRVRGPETEYQIGIIPLGGYVRILGDDGDTDDGEVDPDDAGRALSARPLWQRLAVVLAGPAANFTLPILIYFSFFAGHTELAAATVGDVVPGSPAARAEIRPGDRVLAIGDESIRYWEQLEEAVEAHSGETLRLSLSRGGHTIEKYVTPVPRIIRERNGKRTRTGYLGITQAPMVPRIGVISPTSPAARAGLRTGDIVVSIDGFEIRHFRELADHIGGIERKTLVFLRGDRFAGLGVTLLSPGVAAIVPDIPIAGERNPSLGIEPAEMFVARVDRKSPAQRAGLLPGDVIDTIDGEPVASWAVLDQLLQSRPDHTFVLTWRRASVDGVATMTGEVTQKRHTITDEYGNRKTALVFGAHNDDPPGAGQMTPIDRRITYAATKAVERTGEAIRALAAGLVAIFRGEAPREAVGGPITMYRAASVSGHKGWDAFLLMIALLSVSVGLINLLPVPAVDGGHVVIFVVEAVRKKPLTPRARDRFGTFGLAVVGVVTILALSSDIARFLLH